MSTVREAWGMACPQCRRDDGIDIVAGVWVRLTPDGTDPDQAINRDHEWNERSPASCRHCQHVGAVASFSFLLRRSA
jgi:hypothetical protein